jgi:tetratricopeptide (TPR) repeat protein
MWLLSCLALGGLFLACVPALADAEAAKEFLRLGKSALKKKKFDEAVTRFEKALGEDPGLIEAQYWIAVAFDKNGDKNRAIQAFRDFLARYGEKKAKGTASRGETRLEGLGRKRLNGLAIWEGKFEKIEKTFISDLIKFAREYSKKDTASAVKALKVLLKICPNHGDAQAFLRRLGGAGEEESDESEDGPEIAAPFRKVHSWKDLLGLKIFKAKDKWTFEGKTLVGDLQDGMIFLPNTVIMSGSAFAVEIEARQLAEYHRGWLIGFIFGHRKGEFLSAFYQKTQLVLRHELASGGTDLDKVAVPPVDPKAWHRLGAIVRGNAIEIWFDGKKVLSSTHPTRMDLNGEIGLFQQRCKAQYRVIRSGKLN